jgi:phosphoribosylanthranilate isomerase
MTKVKICGITNIDDALCAVNLGADFLGFVFYNKSPRYISPVNAKRIIQQLPKIVNKVGVFVNAREKTVKKIARSCELNYIQLHGDEGSSYCHRVVGRIKKDLKIIKAFRIKDADSLKDITDYEVDAYLLDTYDKKVYGGSGKSFNWNLISKVKNLNLPIILSGGLNPKNVKKAVKRLRPYAVDVSSGVEKSVGKKDYKLMKDFILAVKEASL